VRVCVREREREREREKFKSRSLHWWARSSCISKRFSVKFSSAYWMEILI